ISLNLFLNWRVAFWAAVGLIVSFLGTFVAMWILGASINMLSRFGLIIVLGIIVDDAIVIGENIYRHIEEGMPPIKAAIQGAEEVMWPVTIAVLTTIAAFAPLFFIRGQIGDFMRQLPIVVVAALSVSLIEALVILPAHLAHMRCSEPKTASKIPPGTRASVAQRLANGFHRLREIQTRMVSGVMVANYERLIRFALRWRYATLAVSTALLVCSFGLVAGGLVEQVFVQDIDSETLICELEMPVGTTAANVKQQLKHLSQHVEQSAESLNVQMFVARVFDMTGSGSPTSDQSHLGQMVVELKPADQRDREGLKSSEELLADFREFSRTELLGVNSVTWQAVSGGPGGKDIHIRVTGDDLSTVQQAVDVLQEQLESFQGVADLDTNLDIGQREVQLRLRPTAAATGITVGMLGSHVRASMFGRESRRITRNREDVRIVVRYPKTFRENLYNIESMWIPSGLTAATRKWIPLHEVAEVTEAQGYTSIHRSQQRRSVTILGSLDEVAAGATTSEILAEVSERFADTPLAREHPDLALEFLGKVEEQQKSFAGLAVAFPVALLMIYTLLAGLFRCYVQPLVVMAAIPFGLQGAIIGHWITGNPITILSWIGFVALSGILVNDSLVLVDFINKHIERGYTRFEASVQGSKLRLRAILLTTLTTIAGLTPLMFETSLQAKFLIPMAVTLTFGLAFATLLTLIIVPTLNMIFFDFKQLTGWSQPTSDQSSPPREAVQTVAAS
ncbi:MAG: efflux RND transporter permease subunit, partial [Planctomycetaceae bacterium]